MTIQTSEDKRVSIQPKKLEPGEALDIIHDLQREYAELMRLVGEYLEALSQVNKHLESLPKQVDTRINWWDKKMNTKTKAQLDAQTALFDCYDERRKK